MVQNLFKGEKIVSHVPLSRVRKSYKKALATATLYKYDPETAKRLLAEAGWKPGSDGMLVNAKGERMEFEFRVTAERRDQSRLSMTLVKSPSLFFSCCLAHPLSSNIGQVVVFIIRFMISPHYKNNLKPLRSQSSKRLRMTVPF